MGGERLPSARRSAVGEPRPAGADGSKASLDLRDQLMVDGIPIGPEIRRIDRVAVIVIGICMIDFDHQESGKVG